MPRANRHFLPDHVWHITHRYHQRALLLKFARDRGRYLRWVFEAKKRFGLRVLEEALTGEMAVRDDRWSEAITVGRLALVNQMKVELGIQAMLREVGETRQTYTRQEPRGAYACDSGGESNALMPDNTIR